MMNTEHDSERGYLKKDLPGLRARDIIVNLCTVSVDQPFTLTSPQQLSPYSRTRTASHHTAVPSPCR